MELPSKGRVQQRKVLSRGKRELKMVRIIIIKWTNGAVPKVSLERKMARLMLRIRKARNVKYYQGRNARRRKKLTG